MAENTSKAAPAAPKLVEMVAVHEVHHAKGVTAPGGKFFIDQANATWLVENGAALLVATTPASPVDPA
jgi:hypothetical protein